MERVKDGKSGGCQGKRCEVCTILKEKNTFTNKGGSDTNKIRRGIHLDCNSVNVIYLITRKKSKKQYLRSCITRFHTRFNNYCSYQRKFCEGHSIIQCSFHAHFMLDGHCGINDWEIFLIDEGRTKQETRRKEFSWQYKLDTFVPHGVIK